MAAPPDPLDVTAIRRGLEGERDRTRDRIAGLAARPEAGSGLRFGKRIGDGTIEAVSRLTDIGVGGSLKHTFARTERALAKLDEGSYGRCDRCGDAILPARLEAMPDSVLCLTCSAAERRSRPSRR